MISSKLSILYRTGHLARSIHKVTTKGYIYSLPEHQRFIGEKLIKITPQRVLNTIRLILESKILYTYQDLIRKTGILPEEIDLWIRGVYSTWNVVKTVYYKSLLFFHSASVEYSEKDYDKIVSEIKGRISKDGRRYEKEILNVIKKLSEILEKQGHKTEFIRHPGTKEGKFLDAMIVFKLFETGFPIRLLFEIKSFVCNTDSVLYFQQKIRHFEGIVIPIIIAPGFSSNCFRYFGHSGIMFLEDFRLKKMVKRGEELLLPIIREVIDTNSK